MVASVTPSCPGCPACLGYLYLVLIPVEVSLSHIQVNLNSAGHPDR